LGRSTRLTPEVQQRPIVGLYAEIGTRSAEWATERDVVLLELRAAAAEAADRVR
jgi:hypothetical protein